MRNSVISATITLALVAMAASGCSSASKGSTAAGGGGSGTGSAAGGSAATTAAAAGGGSSADINACTLLSVAQATSLVGKTYTAAQNQTIATGQDQCTYTATNNGSSLVVIIYQPNSGVTWTTLTTVQNSAGTVNNVSGVGDKAIIGAIEIDVQAGTHLIAVQGAGGTLSGHTDNAAAVAKAIVAALG